MVRALHKPQWVVAVESSSESGQKWLFLELSPAAHARQKRIFHCCDQTISSVSHRRRESYVRSDTGRSCWWKANEGI